MIGALRMFLLLAFFLGSFCEDCKDGQYKGNFNQCFLCRVGNCCYANNEYPAQSGTYIKDKGVGRPNIPTCKDESSHSKIPCTCAENAIPCPAGFYCPTGSTSGDANPCLTGFYCPEGTGSPILCADGFYCLSGNQYECNEGMYCPIDSESRFSADNNQKECPLGYYCPKKTIEPIECPAGSYCKGNGLANHQKCPDGSYCPKGSIVPIICPEGTFCNNASSNASICPEGYYCPERTSDPIECSYSHVCPEGSAVPIPCECSNHGTCTIDDLTNCTCEEGYNLRSDCGGFSCFGVLEDTQESCTLNGKCIGVDECECFGGYYGEICSQYNCSCQNGGICVSPGKCSCSILFQGDSCDSINPTVALVISLSGGAGLVLLFGIFIIAIIICICFSIVLKKAKRFDHIENIDLVAKEMELEQKQTPNSYKIKQHKSKYIINYSEIKLLSVIGSGASSSTIYKIEWQGNLCAYKAFNSAILSQQDNTESLEEFQKELEVCANVNHPSILQFYGACINPPKIGLVMEYASNGDLCSFILDKKNIEDENQFPIQEKLRIANEIVSGMMYLHGKEIIHRDLKPENVLVNDQKRMKIMDFGLSKVLRSKKTGNEEITMTKQVGTSFYMAPEVIIGKKYSFTADVYSFSVLLYALMTENFSPFGVGVNQAVIMKKVSSDPSFRPKLEKEDFQDCEFLIPIIKKNWNHKPEERNSFQELQKELKKLMTLDSVKN